MKAKKARIDASHRMTGGGPAEVPELTAIEHNLISLLGQGFGSGMPGARVEPFDVRMIHILLVKNNYLGFLISDRLAFEWSKAILPDLNNISPIGK